MGALDKPIAVMVDGHLVRGASLDQFAGKLRALGQALDFEVEVTEDGGVRIAAVCDHTVVVADPATLPN